jgi:hypothetical protein
MGGMGGRGVREAGEVGGDVVLEEERIIRAE